MKTNKIIIDLRKQKDWSQADQAKKKKWALPGRNIVFK
jgi:hypothetical protein